MASAQIFMKYVQLMTKLTGACTKLLQENWCFQLKYVNNHYAYANPLLINIQWTIKSYLT